MKKLILAFASLVLTCCALQSWADTPKKDGELAVPADYKKWPKYLSDVQRPDAKQIRDIYINPTGAAAKAGGAFANGTMMVMEIYKAKEGANGAVLTGADGKLVRGELFKVFVMGKGAGWGAAAPEGLKNGDWAYSAYLADGKTASPEPTTPCRACHLPLGESKDFIHRYDEYFQKRS